MRLHRGTIPMNEKEKQQVDALCSALHVTRSVTRRDPGDTGPLLVQLDNKTWVVDEKGWVTEG